MSQHLTEVNNHWKGYALPDIFQQHVEFENDNQRIQTHLRLVEETLRARELPGFSKKQLEKRTHNLDVLRNYGLAAIFPTNHYHPDRQPYFVDNFGVKCAVGYLIWQSGGQDLVHKISRENNFGYLGELATLYPEIGHWATENGFTVAELGWIQPTYPTPKPNYENWGSGQGLNPGGKVNVMAPMAATPNA